jgi:hypothetical protein
MICSGVFPAFIESGPSGDSKKIPSFDNISELLKEKDFTIADGIHSNGVSAFVSLTNPQKNEENKNWIRMLLKDFWILTRRMPP